MWGDISLWFWFAFPWWLEMNTLASTCWLFECLLGENVYSLKNNPFLGSTHVEIFFIINTCWICKLLFSIHWDDHIFILHFVNVVYHIDWFVDVKPSLHPWIISHLIMVYNPFTILLILTYQDFVDNFWIYGHQGYWCIIFFSCGVLVWFWQLAL